MSLHLDDEAMFREYVAQGSGRSYANVAAKFDTTKRRIVRVSKRGNWLARLAVIERDAKVEADRRLTESRAEVDERHLRMIRAIASRGLQGLQAHQFDNARDSARAVEAAVKLERTVLGQPNEHLDVTVQEVTRRELDHFLTTEDEDNDDEP